MVFHNSAIACAVMPELAPLLHRTSESRHAVVYMHGFPAGMYLEYVLGSRELFSDHAAAAPHQPAQAESGTWAQHAMHETRQPLSLQHYALWQQHYLLCCM